MDELQQVLFENYVLFYADYLSLRDTYTPVSDVCKYYFILGAPINASNLVGLQPIYDVNSTFYIQSYTELSKIYNKFGYDGLKSFIENICNMFAIGVVDGELILKCILCFEDKKTRTKAVRTYKQHMKSISYTQECVNDDGNIVTEKCSKYVYHVNQWRMNNDN